MKVNYLDLEKSMRKHITSIKTPMGFKMTEKNKDIIGICLVCHSNLEFDDFYEEIADNLYIHEECKKKNKPTKNDSLVDELKILDNEMNHIVKQIIESIRIIISYKGPIDKGIIKWQINVNKLLRKAYIFMISADKSNRSKPN